MLLEEKSTYKGPVVESEADFQVWQTVIDLTLLVQQYVEEERGAGVGGKGGSGVIMTKSNDNVIENIN